MWILVLVRRPSWNHRQSGYIQSRQLRPNNYQMNRHEPLWRIEAFNPSRVAAWGPAFKAFAHSMLRKDP